MTQATDGLPSPVSAEQAAGAEPTAVEVDPLGPGFVSDVQLEGVRKSRMGPAPRRVVPWGGPNVIISGGQTGVDRAGLDAARIVGIPLEGWCPRGRRAEDGAVPSLYPLKETVSDEYLERTALNIRDADATLVIWRGAMSPGTHATVREADRQQRTLILLRLGVRTSPAEPAVWLSARISAVKRLNVAGPRESKCPGIYLEVRNILVEALREFRRPVK